MSASCVTCYSSFVFIPLSLIMPAPTIVLPLDGSGAKNLSSALLRCSHDFPKFKGFIELLTSLTQSLEDVESENKVLLSKLNSLQDDLTVSRMQVKSLLQELSQLSDNLNSSSAVLDSAMKQNKICMDLITELSDRS